MPETRAQGAQSNSNEPENHPLSLEIISQLIINSTTSLQESFSVQMLQMSNEIKKVNETLTNQQQDTLSI